MSEELKTFKASLPGREELELNLSVDSKGVIKSSKLLGVGGPEFLSIITVWRSKIKGETRLLEVPQGKDIASILLRELILKAQGRWEFPYQDDEICHCRAIPTKNVDTAIICGAHTAKKVSELTSASTACGTCRPDVEAIINYRLVGR